MNNAFTNRKYIITYIEYYTLWLSILHSLINLELQLSGLQIEWSVFSFTVLI